VNVVGVNAVFAVIGLIAIMMFVGSGAPLSLTCTIF
jgi:hypothetical protein